MSHSPSSSSAHSLHAVDQRAHARRRRPRRGATKGGRAWPFAVAPVLLAAAALLFAGGAARAQIGTGGSGGQHSIYGEFKVDESKAAGEMVSISFVLVLMTDSGKVVERQSVMSGTRYQFLGLRDGFYDIVVESAGTPVVRLRVQLTGRGKVELKQDIALEWDKPFGSKSVPKKGAVSAADYYQRPPANQSLFDKASAAIRKKKFDEAAALLQKIVEADPKDYLAWTDLGTMHYALGNAAEAERSYARALAERPDLLAAAVNLGRLRVAEKNYEKAIEVLKPAVEKHAQSADANHLLGEAYLQTAKYDEAVAHLDEALRIDPQGKAEAHLRLAMLYDAARMKDKAAAQLEQFLAKRPAYPDRKKFEQYIKENRKK